MRRILRWAPPQQSRSKLSTRSPCSPSPCQSPTCRRGQRGGNAVALLRHERVEGGHATSGGRRQIVECRRTAVSTRHEQPHHDRHVFDSRHCRNHASLGRRAMSASAALALAFAFHASAPFELSSSTEIVHSSVRDISYARQQRPPPVARHCCCAPSSAKRAVRYTKGRRVGGEGKRARRYTLGAKTNPGRRGGARGSLGTRSVSVLPRDVRPRIGRPTRRCARRLRGSEVERWVLPTALF